MQRSTWLVLSVAASLIGTISSASATIVNIDLEGYRTAGGGIDSNVPPTTYIGVGAAGGGTVFNGVSPTALSDNTSSPITGDNQTLTANGLADSTGLPTGINFTVSSAGVDNENPNIGSPTNPSSLFNDYIFDQSAGNTSTSPFTISGLGTATTANIYFYVNQGIITFDSGATPSTFTPTGIYTTGNTIFYANVPVSGGEITGHFGATGSQNTPMTTAVINGLTIVAAVPEPASVVLFGLGAIGLFVVARRRRA